MDRFFNMDNKFFSMMSKVADLILLNVLCIVCSIPIITAGASITAMFYVTLKMVRNEESYIIKSFFKSFKENFKQATIINIIMLVVGGVLYLDITLVRNMDTSFSRILLCIFMVFVFLYLLVFIYVYPVLAKFYNSVRRTFINSIFMAVRHLPYTIIMLIVTVLPFGIALIPYAQILSLVLLLFVLFGFSAMAYINSIFFVKIFDNYIPAEEAEKDTAL
ncbi:MAG: YesL family protein [Blautia sp.]|nr:YesL family protein [Blautia sp.]